MADDIVRNLRHAPLAELGPVSWQAAELIERLLAEVQDLRSQLKVPKSGNRK